MKLFFSKLFKSKKSQEEEVFVTNPPAFEDAQKAKAAKRLAVIKQLDKTLNIAIKKAIEDGEFSLSTRYQFQDCSSYDKSDLDVLISRYKSRGFQIEEVEKDYVINQEAINRAISKYINGSFPFSNRGNIEDFLRATGNKYEVHETLGELTIIMPFAKDVGRIIAWKALSKNVKIPKPKIGKTFSHYVISWKK